VRDAPHDALSTVEPDVTARDVLAALEEFDAISQEAFLSKYGFGRAHGSFLVRDCKEYDSKAVVGAAYRHRHRMGLPRQV
jgi:5-methylcytosine-specific restriction protein A